jgi:monothiol glutaredoxin
LRGENGYNRPHIKFRKSLLFTQENAMSSIEDTIRDQIKNNPIILYMKGNPNQPQCGFSARASQIMMACGEKFAYVDILSNPEIRANLPKVSEWPTFPQLFVDGELVGGCDIMTEMFESGELKKLIGDSAAKRAPAAQA